MSWIFFFNRYVLKPGQVLTTVLLCFLFRRKIPPEGTLTLSGLQARGCLDHAVANPVRVKANRLGSAPPSVKLPMPLILPIWKTKLPSGHESRSNEELLVVTECVGSEL